MTKAPRYNFFTPLISSPATAPGFTPLFGGGVTLAAFAPAWLLRFLKVQVSEDLVVSDELERGDEKEGVNSPRHQATYSRDLRVREAPTSPWGGLGRRALKLQVLSRRFQQSEHRGFVEALRYHRGEQPGVQRLGGESSTRFLDEGFYPLGD